MTAQLHYKDDYLMIQLRIFRQDWTLYILKAHNGFLINKCNKFLQK